MRIQFSSRDWFYRPNFDCMERLKIKLHDLHSRIPLLKKLPPRAVAIVVFLGLINCVVWAACGVVLRYHPELTGSAVLAYTFGLRHALDADHISAIDLMTRRLIVSNQRPVTVGTWFSLGHSTIVVITSLVVAGTASAISKRFNSFSYIGGIIGTSVSATFLLILGSINAYILVILYRQMQKVLAARAVGIEEDEEFKTHGAGCLFNILKKLFKLIDRPWKMYPLGVMFGLGFDTSSEIALLGLSSLRAAQGTSIWLILIFPVLFTAGMCLLDTLDGALMMALYTSASLAKDKVAVLYYNIVLSVLTVVVAIVIGIIQWLGLGLAVVGDDAADHGFWKGVNNVENSWDVVGGGICGLFLVTGVASVLFYKPWRSWIEKRIARRRSSNLESTDPKNDKDTSVLSMPGMEIELETVSADTGYETGKGASKRGLVEITEIVEEEISAGSSGRRSV